MIPQCNLCSCTANFLPDLLIGARPLHAPSWAAMVLELAKAIPENQYGFRPAKDVRSIEEVIVHVSVNNYLLLDMMGKEAPKDLYPDLPRKGMDRQRAIVKANQGYEKKIAAKQNVVPGPNGHLRLRRDHCAIRLRQV